MPCVVRKKEIAWAGPPLITDVPIPRMSIPPAIVMKLTELKKILSVLPPLETESTSNGVAVKFR